MTAGSGVPSPALDAYDLTPPVELSPPSGGTNTPVLLVRTGVGEFVWKGYTTQLACAPRPILARLPAATGRWVYFNVAHCGRSVGFVIAGYLPVGSQESGCHGGL